MLCYDLDIFPPQVTGGGSRAVCVNSSKHLQPFRPQFIRMQTLPSPFRMRNVLSRFSTRSRSSSNGRVVWEIKLVREGSAFGLEVSMDNIVTSVVEGGSAAAADIAVGDRVISVDGQPIGDRNLVSLLAQINAPAIALEIERLPPCTPLRSSRTSRSSKRRSLVCVGTCRKSSSDESAALDDSPQGRSQESLQGLKRSASFASPGQAIQ